MNLARKKRPRRMCEKIAWQLGWEARGVNSGADHFEQLHGNNLEILKPTAFDVCLPLAFICVHGLFNP